MHYNRISRQLREQNNNRKKGTWNMSIVRWEPLRDFMTLREAMDKLFQESFVGPRHREWLAPTETTSHWTCTRPRTAQW